MSGKVDNMPLASKSVVFYIIRNVEFVKKFCKSLRVSSYNYILIKKHVPVERAPKRVSFDDALSPIKYPSFEAIPYSLMASMT